MALTSLTKLAKKYNYVIGQFNCKLNKIIENRNLKILRT